MRVGELIEVMDLAKDYGISSIEQLKMFLEIGRYRTPRTLKEIANVDDGYDPEYRRHNSLVRKLGKGSNTRKNDGLLLVQLGERAGHGKERTIIYTAKGLELFNRLSLFTDLYK